MIHRSSSLTFGAKLARSFALPALILLGAASLTAQNSSFVSFDAPGAGNGETQATVASSINLKGAIAGYYFDSSFVQHGFLRQPSGQFTDFTPPNLSDVIVYAINNSNQILGTGSLTIKPYQFRRISA